MPPLTAVEIDRDYVTDGVPSSGVHQVRKSDRRAWGSWVEQIIMGFLSNGGVIYASRALLNADLGQSANTMAWVVEDVTPANNGVYRKIGASGAGSWVRAADLPYSFIIAFDVGEGAANSIVATSPLPIPGSALVLFNVYQTNTGSPVTVSFNGGSALTIKTNSGNDVAPGGLISGTLLVGRVSGSTFRLVSDQASAAIIAQAESLVNRAEAAEDAVLGLLGGVTPVFATAALAEAYSPTVAPGFLQLVGYGAAGDGGGALYKQVASEPAHGGKLSVTLDDGVTVVWYEVSEDVQRLPAYGAVPATIGSASENASALRFAIDRAVEDGEGVIEIPGKLWHMDSKVAKTIGSAKVGIRGEKDQTTFRWTGADGGIDLTVSDHTSFAHIRGLNFETDYAGGGTALKFTSPDLPTATEQGILIEDVDCRGDGGGYWGTGIHLVNCWHPQVVRPDMKGVDLGTQVFPMDHGIRFTDCQAPVVRDLMMFHMDTAIVADGAIHGEGVNISGGEIVGVNKGIIWTPDVFKPGITIHDLHINAYFKAIQLVNYGQCVIHDLLLYKTQLSDQSWTGIELVNCHDNGIHDIKLCCPAAMVGGANGIVLIDSNDNRIHDIDGSQWNVAGTLVVLAGSSDWNKIHDIDRSREATLLQAVDFLPGHTGKNNRFWNIWPSGSQTLAANSGSPSVGNDLNGVWRTANTVPTLITNFPNSKGTGHIIKVRAYDTNTTIAHNGSGTDIFVATGANVSIPVAQTMTFMKEDNAWVEIGRSF